MHTGTQLSPHQILFLHSFLSSQNRSDDATQKHSKFFHLLSYRLRGFADEHFKGISAVLHFLRELSLGEYFVLIVLVKDAAVKCSWCLGSK